MKKILLLPILGLLFAVNLYLIFPFLVQSSPGWIESIEVSFITIGRWWVQNWPHIWWNPYWYAGFPMRFSYVPLLPVSVAILGSLMGSFAKAYYLISGLAYALVPVSLFFLLRYLTKNNLVALFGALAFSLLPPLSGIFNYAKEAQALFPDQYLPPWRLMILVIWGEGPHTLAQVFLPLSALFYLKLLEENKYRNLILCAVFSALVALSNPIGLWALAIFFALTCVVFLVWKDDKGEIARKTVVVILITYLLSSFWYTFGFIKSDLLGEGGGVIKKIFSYFPWGFLGSIFFFSLLLFILKRFIRSAAKASVVLWFIVTFFVVWIFYEFGIELSPQARRYITEVDMGQAIFLSLLVTKVANFISLKFKKGGKLFTYLIPLLFIVLLLIFSRNTWPAAKYFTGVKNEAKTGYKEKYMVGYLTEKIKKNERVFASANYAFWLNYYTDIWQLRGGHWQASIHPWQAHAEYQIIHGKDGETSLYWLKAFAINTITVNTFASNIHYRDYEYPDKFIGILDDGEQVVYPTEIVYRVPLKHQMAGAVPIDRMNQLLLPENGADEQALKGYVDWIEASDSFLLFTQINNDYYQIKGETKEGEAIRLAMSYDKGFKAYDNTGKKLEIKKDILGFLLIKPEKRGYQEITLRYGPTLDFFVGWFLFIVGIIVAFKYKTNFKNENT